MSVHFDRTVITSVDPIRSELIALASDLYAKALAALDREVLLPGQHDESDTHALAKARCCLALAALSREEGDADGCRRFMLRSGIEAGSIVSGSARNLFAATEAAPLHLLMQDSEAGLRLLKSGWKGLADRGARAEGWDVTLRTIVTALTEIGFHELAREVYEALVKEKGSRGEIAIAERALEINGRHPPSISEFVDRLSETYSTGVRKEHEEYLQALCVAMEAESPAEIIRTTIPYLGAQPMNGQYNRRHNHRLQYDRLSAWLALGEISDSLGLLYSASLCDTEGELLLDQMRHNHWRNEEVLALLRTYPRIARFGITQRNLQESSMFSIVQEVQSEDGTPERLSTVQGAFYEALGSLGDRGYSEQVREIFKESAATEALGAMAAGLRKSGRGAPQHALEELAMAVGNLSDHGGRVFESCVAELARGFVENVDVRQLIDGIKNLIDKYDEAVCGILSRLVIHKSVDGPLSPVTDLPTICVERALREESNRTHLASYITRICTFTDHLNRATEVPHGPNIIRKLCEYGECDLAMIAYNMLFAGRGIPSTSALVQAELDSLSSISVATPKSAEDEVAKVSAQKILLGKFASVQQTPPVADTVKGLAARAASVGEYTLGYQIAERVEASRRLPCLAEMARAVLSNDPVDPVRRSHLQTVLLPKITEATNGSGVSGSQFARAAHTLMQLLVPPDDAGRILRRCVEPFS